MTKTRRKQRFRHKAMKNDCKRLQFSKLPSAHTANRQETHKFEFIGQIGTYDYFEKDDTDVDDLVSYLTSLASLKALNDVPAEKLKEIIMEHAVNGVVDLPKEYGMFVAKG